MCFFSQVSYKVLHSLDKDPWICWGDLSSKHWPPFILMTGGTWKTSLQNPVSAPCLHLFKSLSGWRKEDKTKQTQMFYSVKHICTYSKHRKSMREGRHHRSASDHHAERDGRWICCPQVPQCLQEGQNTGGWVPMHCQEHNRNTRFQMMRTYK